jgi:DNA polymerase I-like protein with 3'-5' exonuclease and polymerase domains
MPNLHRAPVEVVAPYAKKDTRLTLDLWEWQRGEIDRQKIHRIVDWERSLMPTLISNEEHGVRVDVDAAEIARDQLTDALDQLQFQLNDICGVPMNPQPCDELRAYLAGRYEDEQWFAIDGTPIPSTNTGKPSFTQDVLQRMVHPAAKTVVEMRKLLKLRDTFINGHVLDSEVNSRIHPRIHQTKGPDGGTSTGRFSYSNPALQQIPSRDKAISSVIRPIFLPEEGHVWVDGDLVSFEVRVFVHLVNNPEVIGRFRKFPETDFHQYVAELTGLPRNKPPEGGSNGKQLNLSMIFNQGKGATAEAMGLPWEWEHWEEKGITYKKAGPEAEAIIEKYHRAVPGIREFAKSAENVAKDRGYLFTKRGRRLRFPRGERTYKASGLLIQATSADLNKENWSLIGDALGGEGHLLINTHDSYGLSLPEDKAERLARDVKEAIETDRNCRVPLILELNNPGPNWWDSYNSGVWM